jgi:hypothetical protein
MKRQKYTISYFVCPECNNVLPLPRKRSSKIDKGHIKDLFCVYCNKVVKTTEVRQGDAYVRLDGSVIYA